MDLVRDSTVQEALKEEFQLPRYNTWANRGERMACRAQH